MAELAAKASFTEAKVKKQKNGEVVLRVQRLTAADIDPMNHEFAERVFKVITELIANESVLDFTVLSDPNVWVMGIFEGVLIDGEFTDPLLIGMATGNFKHTWTGWKIVVDDVVVFSKNRHKGVGRALMAAMEELGAKHDPPCKAVVLTSDRNDAFAFYYRIGYQNRGAEQFKKPI